MTLTEKDKKAIDNFYAFQRLVSEKVAKEAQNKLDKEIMKSLK